MRLVAFLTLIGMVLGSQALAKPNPTGTFLADPEAFIGTSVTVPASFSNTGDATGYGPYVDVIVPAGSHLDFTGASYLGVGLSVIEFVGPADDKVHPYHGHELNLASGETLLVVELPFGSSIPGQPTIDIDLGFDLSPDAPITEDQGLTIIGGFRYGTDPLDNPGTDLPLRQTSPEQNAGHVSPRLVEVNKHVLAPDHDTPIGPTFRHTYEITVDIAPGQTISSLEVIDSLPTSIVYLADSITVRGPAGPLDFRAGFRHSGDTCDTAPTGAGSDVGPCAGTDLVITVDGDVTVDEEAAAPGRVTFQFDFYIDLFDAHGEHTGSNEGDQGHNTATVDGTWLRNDSDRGLLSDLEGLPADTLTDDDQLTLTNDLDNDDGPVHDDGSNGTIRLQKWVGSAGESSATAAIMDNVTFILDFQVSDPSVFGDVVIIDVLPDGLEFNEGSAELTVWRHGTEIVNGVSITPGVDTATDQTLTFNVTDLVSGGLLIGACVPLDGGEPDCEEVAASRSLRGQITYTAEVLRNYRNTDFGSVVQNDELVNAATVTGKIHGPGSDFPVTEFTDTDGDDATVRINRALASKRIHAINDELRATDATGVPMITSGDIVTFALRLDLGELSFKDLVLEDFLPLPVFDITSNGTVPFNTSPTGDWETPTPYTAWFGPGTDSRITATDSGFPTVSASMTADTNSVRLDLGSYTHPSNSRAAAAIEIMLAVPVVDAQLADGLYVTNLLRVTERNTATTEAIDQNIVQLQYTRPVLNISNGVIDVTGDSSLPPEGYEPVTLPTPVTSQAVNGAGGEGERLEQFDRNEEGLDARDLVTYLVIVENEGLGRKGAWDVTLREALPPGLPYTAIQRDTPLEIRRGNGFLLATIDSDADWAALFGQGGSDGYTIANPVIDGETTAVLGRAYLESDPETRVNDGTNLLYFTYQAELPANAEIYTTFETISHVPRYAAQADGRYLTDAGLVTDDVYVTIIGPDPVKSIVATSEPHTPSGDPTPLAIGEIIRYRLTVTIPEGQATNMVITDALPGGLQYLPGNTRIAYVVDPDTSLAFGPTSIVGVPRYADADAVPPILNAEAGNSALLPDAMVTSISPLTFSLGNVVNGASDAPREQIIIEFNALVLDSSANSRTAEVGDAARTKSNRFTVTAGVGDTRDGQTSNTVTAQIEEPALTVSKEHDDLDNLVDAGATVEYKITITNTGGATAFDLELEDELPPHVTRVTDPATTEVFEASSAVNAAWAFADDGGPDEMTGKGSYIVTAGSLPAGGTITLTFDVTLDSTVPSNADVTNTAHLTEASSLPGDGTDHKDNPTGNPTGANTPEQVEDTCADCGERDYEAEGSATFTTLAIALEKEVVATSESWTEDPDVAIGEIVRYRVIAHIPEGVNEGFTLTDELPAGLTYVDVGGTNDQVRFALVGTDLESSNAFLPQATNPGAAETCSIEELSLVALGTGQDVFGTPTGNTLTFNLGDLTNGARDDSPACVVIEYNAFVNGTASSSAATADQTNKVTGEVNGAPTGEAEATVTVVEPNLQVSKVVTSVNTDYASVTDEGNASNVDVGNQVTFEAVISNPAGSNTSTAWNILFTDELDAQYKFVSGIYTLPDDNEQDITASGQIVSFNVDAHLDRDFGLEPGQSITVTYTVEVGEYDPATAAWGDDIDNTAVATAMSVPPTIGTDNPTGSSRGEDDARTYQDEDDANVALAEPELGLAKALTTGPTALDDGHYALTFEFIVRNTGIIPLTDVQIVDDLAEHFAIPGSMTITSVNLSGADGLEEDFDGVDNTAFFAGDGIDLAVDEAVTVQLELEVLLEPLEEPVDPDEDLPIVFNNFADATGETPGGIPAGPRRSTDGGDPTPTDEPTDTTVRFTEDAALALTKTVVSLDPVEDGTYDLTYSITATNTGEVTLRDLSLTDDLNIYGDSGTFSFTVTGVELASGPDTMSVNWPGFNGDDVTELLAEGSSFGPGEPDGEGESFTVLIHLNVSPQYADEVYTNTVNGSGRSPLNQKPEAEAVVEHPFEVEPELGIYTCLPASGIVQTDTLGLYDVTFTVHLQNFGNVQLNNLMTELDLSGIFSAADDWTYVSAAIINDDPAAQLIELNDQYDGDSDTELFSSEQTLFTANQSEDDKDRTDQITVEVMVQVMPGEVLGYLIHARAEAQSPIAEVDQDGWLERFSLNDCNFTAPDPEESVPDEPIPTPLEFANNPLIGIAKAFTHLEAVEGEQGTFDIQFTFVLRNYGNVQLFNVSLFDDFSDVFLEDDTWTITEIEVTAAGSGLTAATPPAGSNPGGPLNLLAPGSTLGTQAQSAGDGPDVEGTVTVSLRVTPDDPGHDYENFAVAEADGPVPPEGSTPPTTEDDSVDGDDPDFGGEEPDDPTNDGDGDPTNNDSPTPFTFETPIIGVAKFAPETFDFGGTTGTQLNPYNVGDGDYLVGYTFTIVNYGDVSLSDLVLTDDLLTQLAQGSPVDVTAVDGTLEANPAYDGSDGSNILLPGQELAFDEGELVTETVSVMVTLRPGAALNSGSLLLENQAQVQGTSPGNNTVEDDSVDGIDPDPDADGDPTNNDGPTVIELTEAPLLAVAKNLQSVDYPGDGTFLIELLFTLENQGDVLLSDVQLFDDLNVTFRGSPYEFVSLSAEDPLSAADLAAAEASGNLLDAAGSTLPVGVSATVTLTFEVTPGDRIYDGPFLNTAYADGTSPGDRTVTDMSNDGTEPDPGDDTPTEIDLVEDPLIGLAKSAEVTALGDGRYDVLFTFTIQNYGNTQIRNLQLTDDLVATFGADTYRVEYLYSPTLSVNAAAPDPTEPAAYDGDGYQNLLLGTDTLAVGATATVQLLVRVTPPEARTYENMAHVTGDSPGGSPVEDDSTDGDDPDPDGDDDPTNNDDPTPVPFEENPLIGLAKNADVTVNTNGTFNVELTFTVRNMGDVPLSNVQITDPLDGIYAVTDLTPDKIAHRGGNLNYNPAYDGRSDNNLLTGSDSLAVGAERQLVIVLQGLLPTTGTATTNSALASGDSPTGTPTEDRSTDGFEPDPDGDDIPDEDTPTPIELERITQIALAKSGALTFADDGTTLTLVFTFNVENTGNVPLYGIQVSDDLAEYYANTNLTAAMITVGSADFTVNPAFDGASDNQMLTGADSLAVGETGTVTVTLADFTANAGVTELANSALADGRGPDGTPTDDPSNDGDTPIPGEDVPTITPLTENPLLGVAKEAGVTVAADGTYTVTFDFVIGNYGNTALRNISLRDDLSAFAAAGMTGVTVTSTDFPVNGSFNGTTDTELLGAGATLEFGDYGRLTLVLEGINGPGSFTNQAIGDGESPSGTPTPPEYSTDGPTPDPNGDGIPDEDEPTPVVLESNPLLGVAKNATVIQNADDSYHVTFNILLRNMGNTVLSSLQVHDDLTEFYDNTDLTAAAITVSSSDLTVNPAFDGDLDTALLTGTDTLAVGAEATVTITMNPVTPPAPVTLLNVATGEGEAPDGTPTTDDSTDGDDPDPNGDGIPDEDTPTPVVLAPQPRIGIAKSADVTANDDGSFDLVFEFTVGNYGNTVLHNVQVRDDLSVFYGPTDISAGHITLSSTDFTVNAGYNGLTDLHLLTGTDTLGIAEFGTITMTISGLRISEPVDTFNTAIATGTDPNGNPSPPDRSTDGDDPDPDGDGDPGNNNDPTPVQLGERPLIGLAKSAQTVSNGDGSYDITFTLTVRNYGDVPVFDLTLTDPLDQFYANTNLTADRVTTGSSTLTLNPAYDGDVDTELLAPGNSLGVGADATVTIALANVIPNAGVTRLDNSALVTGTGPDGSETSDTSTDGDDPDPDGSGPGNHSTPTPVNFGESLALLLSKEAHPGPYTVGDRISYTLTITNPNDVPTAITLTDATPAATAYIAETATFNPAAIAPSEGSEPRQDEPGVLTWRAVVLPAGETVTVSYELRVLPGAESPLINTATVLGTGVSAEATQSVEVDQGVFDLDTGMLIGRVYLDVNRNNTYDEGIDVPLANARVVLANGWQTLTDVQGNYAFRELDTGTWTVMVDQVTAPYQPTDHPEQLRDPRQHRVQVQGVTVSDFPFTDLAGLASVRRETTVNFGPIEVHKYQLLLGDTVRVVFEVSSEEAWPPLLITDPVPGGDPREFVVELTGEETVYLTHDLPAGAQLTDPEIEWSNQ